MEFTLKFNMDNEAFDRDAGEVERIFLTVLARWQNGHASHPIRDINGNHIGAWEITS